MSEEDTKENSSEVKQSEKPKKKRLWLKVLFILFGLFCALVIGIYFYVSSASFIRNQVFARVQEKLNQPVTAEEISFSPLSSLELTNFSLGDDPFLKAGKIKLSYELIPMLSNKINVSEVTIENAELNVIIDRDGNLNIQSKMVKTIEDNSKKDKKASDKGSETEKEQTSDVPEINIQNINFKNLKLHVFKDDSKEERQKTFNLENFSFSIPSIKNGEDLKFELETAINCKAGEQFNLKKGLIKVSGSYKLSQKLVPETVNLDIKISELDAINEGVQLPLKALNILTDIKIDGEKVTLNKINIQNPLGKAGVSVSGVLNKNEVDLKLAVTDLDSSILDLALVPLSGNKAFMRWQKALSEASEGKVAGFGDTVINFNGSIKGKPENKMDTEGELEIRALPLVKISRKSSIVPVTAKISYNLSSNEKEKLLEVKKLSIDLSDNTDPLLSLKLNSPLRLDTANNKLTSDKDEQVTLVLNNFDLNLLKAFMKEDERDGFERGFISTDCQLVSKNSGGQIILNLNSLSINELALRNEDAIIANINIHTSSRLSINDLAKVNLLNLAFNVKQDNKDLASIQASGLINLDNIEANISISKLKVFPHIKSFISKETLKELGLENINLSSEKLQVHYSKGGLKAEGKMLVKDMSIGGSKLPAQLSLTQSTNFKISVDETKTLNIESLELNLLTDQKPALSLKLSGKHNQQLQLASLHFSDLRVQSGLDKFIPKDLKVKYGLENINLDSKDLKIEAQNGKVSIKGSIFSNGLKLGGEEFKDNFSLNHSTTLDVQLIKDQLVDIKALNLSIQTNNNEALNFAVKATFKPGDKELYAKISQLDVSPGLRNLFPPKILEQFGLLNVNAKSNGLELSFAEGKPGFVKGDLVVDKLGIGGTSYQPFFISQSLKINLAIDNQGILKIDNFHSKTKPSFADEVELRAKGKVDLNFVRDDSEISLDIPSVINLDALLKLAKNQERKTASQEKEPEEKKPAQVGNAPANPGPVKKKSLKLTVKTSINEILFDQQSIKNIKATAFIDGQNYTLKEAVLQMGDAVIKAAGKMKNGPDKSLSLNISSSGPIDLSPINDILNKGTEKKLSGTITIKQISAVSSGKTNEDLTNNLKASGQLYIHDMKLSNYAQSGGMDWVLDNIIGVNPANINFQQGIMDINMENSILKLNQMDFDGKSLGFNPRGTIDLKNNIYDIRLNTAAGFAGGTLIQNILNKPELVNFINSKTDELIKFQKRFPYDNVKKKFMLKEDFPFNQEIRLSNKGQQATLLESAIGLNSVTSNLLTAFFIEVAKQAQMKEAASFVGLLNGDINTKSILDIGKGLLEKELNKKNGKDKMDDNKSKDPLGSLLDILGGGKKKKKQEEQQKPKEEKKKDEPINKEDDLIKKLDNLFK